MAGNAPKISQKEYLKKYLSGGTDEKKKDKKKKKKAKTPGFAARTKIIDDDVDLSKLQLLDESALDLYETNEDAPVIAGIIDERPIEVQAHDMYKVSQRWKVLSNPDGEGISVSENKSNSSGDIAIQNQERDSERSFGAEPTVSSVKSVPTHRGNYEADQDASPPRKRAVDNDVSPPRRKSACVTDLSPPRKNQAPDKPHVKNTSRGKYDDDVSPPRRKYTHDFDPSPPRRKTSITADMSPPRRKRSNVKNVSWGGKDDISPPRRKHNFDSHHMDNSDMSPPRKKSAQGHDTIGRKRYDSDTSPPRKKTEDTFDMSIPRKGRHVPVFSSKNEKNETSSREHKKALSKKYHGSDFPPQSHNRCLSPSEIKREPDSDESPPRRCTDGDTFSSKRQEDRRLPPSSSDRSKGFSSHRGRVHSSEEGKKMEKTLDGKIAGLQDASKLKEELQQVRRREDEAFSKMDTSVSGKGAAAVQRNRATGMKRNIELEVAVQKEKEEIENRKKEKYSRWGKGVKQTEDQKERLARDLYEMSKPLARYADDQDLEQHLRNRERDGEGDPMLEYLRRKKNDDASHKAKPIYQGSFPPNRYGIRPGYRWDGRDRSNGYEQKYFENINARKAVEEEAYKWSTSDM